MMTKRKEKMSMAKHEKTEVLTAQVMPNEWYEARIATLEKENLALHERIHELEDSAARAEKAFNIIEAEYISKVEYDELVAKFEELQDEHVEKCHMFEDLKEALVRSALREVGL